VRGGFSLFLNRPFSRKEAILLSMASKLSHRLVAVLAVAGVFSLAGCSEVYTRDDFKAKVDGKSMDDVRAEIGKPVQAQQDAAGTTVWVYERRTIDIENKNKRDNRTVLVFTAPAPGGKSMVSEVRFE
jgi:hypothetical protein